MTGRAATANCQYCACTQGSRHRHHSGRARIGEVAIDGLVGRPLPYHGANQAVEDAPRYNGEQFLSEQLASLQAQTVHDWMLYWRDGGSTDATPRIMKAFLTTLGYGRSIVVPGDGRLGAAESFMRLLRVAAADGCGAIAFADHDDVWMPEKLPDHGLCVPGGRFVSSGLDVCQTYAAACPQLSAYLASRAWHAELADHTGTPRQKESSVRP